ncbi:MAG: aldo/keto reductase [Lachnospiraceae bacterium]
MKKLGFGTMRMPLINADDPASVNIEQVKKMVDLFLERGFTYFDTAYMYHNYASETSVKAALTERYPREAYVLADKLPLSHLKKTEDNERIFNEQLEKCGVEYFDYYLLHCITNALYETAVKLDCFAFISRLKAEGRVKKIGFSFHGGAELLETILKKHLEVEFVQLQINYIDWDSPNIQSRECYELCRKYGKEILVMEPVKGGTLANVPEQARQLMKAAEPDLSPASWAIRFAASQEGVSIVLSGMSKEEQLLDNTAYMADFKPLYKEEQKLIDQVKDIINSSIAIPCTTCGYCVESCPKKIPIPQYFSLFNQFKQFGEGSGSRFYYKTYQDSDHGTAGECIRCRRCEKACPQHLDVADYLKQVSGEFDRAQ